MWDIFIFLASGFEMSNQKIFVEYVKQIANSFPIKSLFCFPVHIE